MDTPTLEFIGFPKITRWTKVNFVITEKIDGTNGCIVVTHDGDFYTQSRNRIIYPEQDNHGFASWAHAHRDALTEFLGIGRHYGEWWGIGIQRGYDQQQRWFSPFNTHAFNAERDDWPEYCRPLPVIRMCNAKSISNAVEWAKDDLLSNGSQAAPGYMNPEGLMIWSRETGYLKYPFDDGEHKWAKTSREARDAIDVHLARLIDAERNGELSWAVI